MGTQPHPTPYSVLDELTQRVDAAVRGAQTPEQRATGAAAAIRDFLGYPRLLQPSQCEPDPDGYRQHVLYVAPDGFFSIVALVWLPGQETSVHDHLAWGAFGVHRGCVQEEQMDVVEDAEEIWLDSIGTVTHRVGAAAALVPPGDVHKVSNPGPELAISIHVYGVNILDAGSSIRRRYHLPVHPGDPALLPHSDRPPALILPS